MRNIKITARLQNGNQKESPIIGIFDFLPFVRIIPDIQKKYQIQSASENMYRKCNVLDISTKMNNAKEFVNLLSQQSSITKIIHPIKGISNSSTVIFDASEGAIHIECKQ